MDPNKRFANRIRWAARIIGTLIVAFNLLMAIGYYMEGQSKADPPGTASLSPIILAMFTVWGIALAGLLLAIWKEGPGGIISLAAFFLVPILNLFNEASTSKSVPFIVFLFLMIPSILYIQYWRLTRNENL